MPSGRISAAKALTTASRASSGGALADEMEAMHRAGEQGLDPVKSTIVCKEMHAAAQLAHEGLRVGEVVAADGGAADVRDQQMRRMPMPLDEAEQRTVAGRLRFLVEPRVVAIMEGHAPAVDVARVGRTMGG